MARRWSKREGAFVLARLGQWGVPALARHLGRTERAVRSWCGRHRARPTREGWVTSGQAAALTGYTPQYLTRLARQGRLPARRNATAFDRRGTRRYWLFRPSRLPRRAA